MRHRKFSNIAGDISSERRTRINAIKEETRITAAIADFGNCCMKKTRGSLSVWLVK